MTLTAGQVLDLTWNFSASAAGVLTVTFIANGNDSSTGLAVSGSATAIITVTP
jgi:hypothetical protein